MILFVYNEIKLIKERAVMATVKRRKHSILLKILLLAFTVYLFISLSNLLVQLNESKKEYAQKSAILEAKKLEMTELESLLESGTEAQLIERAARDRLGYVYPDEQIFIDYGH